MTECTCPSCESEREAILNAKRLTIMSAGWLTADKLAMLSHAALVELRDRVNAAILERERQL